MQPQVAGSGMRFSFCVMFNATLLEATNSGSQSCRQRWCHVGAEGGAREEESGRSAFKSTSTSSGLLCEEGLALSVHSFCSRPFHTCLKCHTARANGGSCDA